MIITSRYHCYCLILTETNMQLNSDHISSRNLGTNILVEFYHLNDRAPNFLIPSYEIISEFQLNHSAHPSHLFGEV